MIVPFSAGGPTDTLARILAERMGAAARQTVIVDNVTGAAGTIGVGKVARAAPDGYTLGIGQWGTHVLNGAIYPLQYDVLNDFAPHRADRHQGPLLLVAQGPAGQRPQIADRLAEGQFRQGHGRHRGVGSASHIAVSSSRR